MKTIITEFLLKHFENFEWIIFLSLFLFIKPILGHYFFNKRVNHNKKTIKELFSDGIIVKSIDEKGKIELENNYVVKRKYKKQPNSK